MNNIQHRNLQDEEVSLKDVINEIKLLFGLVKKNIIAFLLCCTIGGAAGFSYAYYSKPTFLANMQFVFRSEGATGAGSLSSGLGSLLGVGAGGNGSALDRIVELLGTRKIVGEALLLQAEVDGKNDLLINHYIRLEELKKKWVDDRNLNKVVFKGYENYEQLDYAQRKAINQISSAIANGTGFGSSGLLEKDFNKNTGIINFDVAYKNENFAIALNKAIYMRLLNFYIEESSYNTNKNVKILQNKVDSIKRALIIAQGASARENDQALGLTLQQDRVEAKSLSIKENILTAMFAEAQRNLENLRYLELAAKPSFSIINFPYSPLKMEKANGVLFLVIGFVLSFLILLLVFRLKTYLKANSV